MDLYKSCTVHALFPGLIILFILPSGIKRGHCRLLAMPVSNKVPGTVELCVLDWISFDYGQYGGGYNMQALCWGAGKCILYLPPPDRTFGLYWFMTVRLSVR